MACQHHSYKTASNPTPASFPFRALLAVAVLSVVISPSSFDSHVLADAIIVTKAMTASTIAEIFIEDESIRVELEIGASDIDGFRNLLPDDLYQRLGHEPRPLDDRMEDFFAEDWVVRVDNGEPLVGEIHRLELRARVRRDEITGEPLPDEGVEAPPALFVEFRFDLASQPKSLTIKPPMQNGYVTATIGFVTYHHGLPLNDFRYLSQAETLDLNWTDPWFSRFRNRNLRRQFDSPLSAFLYIEPFEVRKEIVVRPLDLQGWVDLGLEGKKVIPVTQQDALKRRVAEFLMKRCPVEIDGRRIEPVLERIHFIRRSLRKTSVVDPPEPLDTISATLGVIFVYPTTGLPQEVRMTWDLFGSKIKQLPTVATDEAGGLPYMLTPDDPVLVWQNFLTAPTIPTMRTVARPSRPHVVVPVVSGACALTIGVLMTAGLRRRRTAPRLSRSLLAANAVLAMLAFVCLPFARVSVANPFANSVMVTTEDAQDTLGALLHNIYRAFDHRDEAVIYDHLAQSITGDLLTDVYLQTRRSMELEGQGGARARVDEVELLELSAHATSAPGRPAFRCRWNVAGSVGHWGHVHRRVNQYEAVLSIAPVNGVWKITRIDLREEKRLDSNTRSPI